MTSCCTVTVKTPCYQELVPINYVIELIVVRIYNNIIIQLKNVKL